MGRCCFHIRNVGPGNMPDRKRHRTALPPLSPGLACTISPLNTKPAVLVGEGCFQQFLKLDPLLFGGGDGLIHAGKLFSHFGGPVAVRRIKEAG